MNYFFRVRKNNGEIISIEDLTGLDWLDIQQAAGFKSGCGCRADELVVNENGSLYLIDSTGVAHAVDPLRFMAEGAK